MYLLELRQAFREPGCPICRLRAQVDGRYLFHVLYEGVTDGTIRLHIAQSMGFCLEHAWELQAIEQERWGDGLGVGIIYKDLADWVVQNLSAYLDSNPAPRVSWRVRLLEQLKRSGRIGRWIGRRVLRTAPAGPLLQRLAPTEPCRACELTGNLVTYYLRWLVENLADPQFLALYEASDGLCLPHLRRALEQAEDDDVARRLVEVSLRRLAPLATDVGEYVRKRDWNNRQEPKHPWEEVSWMRAVAFFSGEAPKVHREEVYRLRETALTEYHSRRVGQEAELKGNQ